MLPFQGPHVDGFFFRTFQPVTAPGSIGFVVIGITDIRVWINEGELSVGADIMYLLVAGRLRTDVLPDFNELLSTIKNDVVQEEEM